MKDARKEAVLGLMDAQIALREAIDADARTIRSCQERIVKNQRLLKGLRDSASKIEAA